MDTHYTDEKNTQIVLGLLKAHKIRKVIASPGTTNIRLVASMQQDSFFEIFSAADERSAAYIACGLAEESGEPVVLSCTGATASRNYIPGLTEAFYRKLPILAITSTQHMGRIGQNIAQVLDRSVQLNDMVKLSVQLPTCYCLEDEWSCNVQTNRAMLELTRMGKGPVHINLETTYSSNFAVENLPEVYPIYRIEHEDKLPIIPNGKIGIFVGAHSKWSENLTATVDRFCEQQNAVVLCDQTSNYRGKYRVLFNLITNQNKYHAVCNDFDLIIHIGNISGAYPNFRSKNEWRVHPDGEIRDTFQHLRYVFAMEEEYFFAQYIDKSIGQLISKSFLSEWQNEYQAIYSNIPELPFSNIWMAEYMANKLPENAILHLGILNTLRSWNFFETPDKIDVYCNTGGFGIDGILSSAIGAALGNPEKIVFCVVGDLAFFYDMNALGNRHIKNNIRILLINNGCGTEFKNYNHPGAQFGQNTDAYIAAANHYGAKSKQLVMHYAVDLGFEYLQAAGKEEFKNGLESFLNPALTEKPMVFEVFTNWEDESKALEVMNNLITTPKDSIKSAIRGIVGEEGVKKIKKLMSK